MLVSRLACLFAIALFAIAMSAPAYADGQGKSVPYDPFSAGNEQNWSGIYLGASLGFAKIEDYDPAFPIGPGVTIPLESQGRDDNWGAHIGFRHRFGDFVAGVEYEYSDLGIQFIGDGLGPLPIFVEESQGVTAQAGFAMDRFYLYGLVGATWVDTNIGLDDWMPTVGIGLDVALSDHLIAGVRYDYSWFEDFDTTQIEGSMDKFTLRIGLQF